MTKINVTIENTMASSPARLTIMVGDSYDDEEALMLAATSCIATRPYYDPDDLFVGGHADDGIDIAECIRVIMHAAFVGRKNITLTVEEMRA